jgi:hypothetical protein
MEKVEEVNKIIQENPSHICPMCAIDPTSHSLSKIRELNGNAVFYTSPAKASNTDRQAILLHYDLILSENKLPWIWIFDCKDYPLSHALDIQTAIELAKLINNKFSNNLDKIVVINSTSFIWVLIKTISFFISKELKDKIHVSENEYNL